MASTDIAKLRASAQDAAKSFERPGIKFTCELISCVPDQLTRKQKANFEWSVECRGKLNRAVTQVRVLDALQRTVPLPHGWRVALQSMDLHAIADEAATAQKAKTGNVSIRCDFLGLPRVPLPATATATLAPGGAVKLMKQDGVPGIFLLCAHIEEDRWLCHPGNFGESGQDGRAVFNEMDLCVADLVRFACTSMPGPDALRDPSLHEVSRVRSAKEARSLDWNYLVAVATLKACELRSRSAELADIDAASAGFENNPFAWVGAGRRSEVAMLWRWFAGTWHYEVVRCELQHFLNKGVPAPAVQGNIEIVEKLLVAAAEKTRESKAPCRYLGVRCANGTYERDPTKIHVGHGVTGSAALCPGHAFAQNAQFLALRASRFRLACGAKAIQAPIQVEFWV